MYLVTPVHAFYVSNAPRNNMCVFKNTRLPIVYNSRKNSPSCGHYHLKKNLQFQNVRQMKLCMVLIIDHDNVF